MRRNLRFFWPRVESRLYAEPKNLVEHGLARAEQTFVGRRARTTYAITDAGRQALAEWLAKPSREPSLWFEALVRVFFAGSGTREDLINALRSIPAFADEIQTAGTFVASQYLEGTYPFPERAHLSGLVFDFLWHYADHLRSWAERSLEEVDGWSDVDPTGKQQRAFDVFTRALAAKGESG
jgi:DNA-binding PadR family transcriptional regulator